MSRPQGLYELEREVCNCGSFHYGYGQAHAEFCPVHEARRQWISRRIDEMVWARLEAEPGFSDELRQAEADIKAEKGTPFSEVGPAQGGER